MTAVIEPSTCIGAVALSVADLERSLAYYQQTIGLTLLKQNRAQVSLGVGQTELLQLHEQPGAQLVRRATGLYHFALRLPNRQDLRHILYHFSNHHSKLLGMADHIFSESVYLQDPDGHGIEIYCDRSRDYWYDPHGQLQNLSKPLALYNLLPSCSPYEWLGLPLDTTMGHIHLQVADIHCAEQFYIGVLGFARTLRMPSASLLSTGSYHHLIGLNTWAGAEVLAPPDDAARLLYYEVLLTSAGLDAVLMRVRAAGLPLGQKTQHSWVVRDPSHNLVLLRQSA